MAFVLNNAIPERQHFTLMAAPLPVLATVEGTVIAPAAWSQQSKDDVPLRWRKRMQGDRSYITHQQRTDDNTWTHPGGTAG